MRVDYIPRHFDLTALRGGNYGELLNLVPLKVNSAHFVVVYDLLALNTVHHHWLKKKKKNSFAVVTIISAPFPHS